MHVAHLERTGHYLTIKDNQIVQVSIHGKHHYLNIFALNHPKTRAKMK